MIKTLSPFNMVLLVMVIVVYFTILIYFVRDWLKKRGRKKLPETLADLSTCGGRNEPERSEYGKGLVLCLCKFIEHWPDLQRWQKLYIRMRVMHPDLFCDSKAIELWANGASDHLYDMEAPVRWKGRCEAYDTTEKLKDLGLTMGHGFTRNRWSSNDALTLKQMAFKIAKKIGFPVVWLLQLSMFFSIHNCLSDGVEDRFIGISLKKWSVRINKDKVKRTFYWWMSRSLQRVALVYDFALGLEPDIGEW